MDAKLDKKSLLLSPSERLHNIEGTQFYVKQVTIGELSDIERLRAGRDWTLAQKLALELHDANGNRIYDVDNEEDMNILENIPVSFFHKVLDESNRVNGANFFMKQIKALSPPEKS